LRRQPTGAILPAEHTRSAEAPVKDIATLQELVDSAAEGTLPHGWPPPGSPMEAPARRMTTLQITLETGALIAIERRKRAGACCSISQGNG
jgi:hypothetical protein